MSTGVNSSSSLLVNQVLLGQTNGVPVPTTLTAGTGITFAPGTGTLTINATGGSGFNWQSAFVTASGTTMNANTGYICNPTSADISIGIATSLTIGQEVKIVNVGANRVSLTLTSPQSIYFNGKTVTSTGSILFPNSTSNGVGNSLDILCIAPNQFVVINSVGNFSFVTP